MADELESLTPFPHAAQNRCFGCGADNPTGLRLEFLIAADRSVVCMTTVSAAFEGPRGCLHGGVIATLLDEAMSKSVRALGVTAVTRHLEVDYLRPVPSGAPIRIEGHLVKSDGRKHETRARILDGERRILARSKGLFIEIQPQA